MIEAGYSPWNIYDHYQVDFFFADCEKQTNEKQPYPNKKIHTIFGQVVDFLKSKVVKMAVSSHQQEIARFTLQVFGLF